MSCRVNVCCLVLTILFVSISIVKSDPATESRINHVCAKSYDYNLCKGIFRAHLFNNVTDFRGLTQIAIAQTLLYSSDTLVFIQKSQRNEPDKNLRNLYQVCVEGYGIVLNQFQDAFLRFGNEDLKWMLFDMSGCERFVNDCESVLGTKVGALHDKNYVAKVLVKMSNVAGELIGTEVIKHMNKSYH